MDKKPFAPKRNNIFLAQHVKHKNPVEQKRTKREKTFWQKPNKSVVFGTGTSKHQKGIRNSENTNTFTKSTQRSNYPQTEE